MRQLIGALTALEEFTGRRADALMCAEAGGLNSATPFCVASARGLPLVDGDLMGRAFPEIQMTLCTLHGITASPLTLADEQGNSLVVNAVNNKFSERFVRSAVSEMGGSACMALYPMTGAQAKSATLRGSLSQLVEVGRALVSARAHNADPIETLRRTTNGLVIYRGKVVDVKRQIEGGFSRGHARIAALDAGRAAIDELVLDFQNEFLVARSGETVLATTPDLIMLLDLETGEPITGELIRFGLRVAVLGVPCVPQWRSEAALELVGPRYFGYDIDYLPVEERAPAI